MQELEQNRNLRKLVEMENLGGANVDIKGHKNKEEQEQTEERLCHVLGPACEEIKGKMCMSRNKKHYCEQLNLSIDIICITFEIFKYVA